MEEIEPPRLADEDAWCAEHTALLISTMKWALLGMAAGLCVGLGTRVFLWALVASSAAGGGFALPGLYALAGDSYAGLGIVTIESAMSGSAKLFILAFLLKIIATAITLETGGSGGIVTPLFFIGSTAGAAMASVLHLPSSIFAAFGFVSALAAAANTPIAACVMGLELLPPGPVGVYAALCACTAFLIVGHRSVYASQKLGVSKSAALEVTLGWPIGETAGKSMRVREGGITHWVTRLFQRRRSEPRP